MKVPVPQRVVLPVEVDERAFQSVANVHRMKTRPHVLLLELSPFVKRRRHPNGCRHCSPPRVAFVD